MKQPSEIRPAIRPARRPPARLRGGGDHLRRRRGVRPARPGQAVRQPDPDGHHPPGQAHRWAHVRSSRTSCPWRARRPGVRGLGSDPRRRLRERGQRGRASHGAPRADQGLPVLHQAHAGGLRHRLRQEAERTQRQEGREQEGARRADPRRHPALQGGARLRPAGDGVVRVHRDLRPARAGARDPRELREGDGGRRSLDRSEPALRLRRDHGGHPLRERGAEPVGRLRGAWRTWPWRRACRSAGRTSRRARP